MIETGDADCVHFAGVCPTEYSQSAVPWAEVAVHGEGADGPVETEPTRREILDVGQCICVLCVTVLYSVCRCGSVHVGLYSLHTFLYVQEFGGVGGVRCVRAWSVSVTLCVSMFLCVCVWERERWWTVSTLWMCVLEIDGELLNVCVPERYWTAECMC